MRPQGGSHVGSVQRQWGQEGTEWQVDTSRFAFVEYKTKQLLVTYSC
jgi:hypothetical protein